MDAFDYRALFVASISEAAKARLVAHWRQRGEVGGMGVSIDTGSSRSAGAEGEFVSILIDEFVAVFSELMFDNATTEQREVLQASGDAFTDLKAFLYVLYRQMDSDGDGRVTWREVVDHVIDEHAYSDSTQRGLLRHSFALSRAWRYNPLLLGAHDEREAPVSTVISAGPPRRRPGATWRARVLARQRNSSCSAASTAADEVAGTERQCGAVTDCVMVPPPTRLRHGADEVYGDGERELPLEPVVALRYLPATQRVLAICKPRQCAVLRASDLAILGSLPQHSSTVVAGEELPLAQGSLFVTTQRDQTVRVWSAHTSPSREDHMSFSLQYENKCPTMQTAVACLPSQPQRVFTGGSRGDMRQWHFSHELLANYRRGDILAFNQISAKAWEPHEWHREAVRCINFQPGTELVATCAADATAVLRDLEKDASVRVFEHQKGLSSLTFSSNLSHCMITCGFEFTPYVWDVHARTSRPQLLADTRDPHTSAIIGVEAVAAMPIVMSCDAAGKLKCWDLRMHRCLETIVLDKLGSGHSGSAATSSARAAGAAMAHHQHHHHHAHSMALIPQMGGVLVAGRNLFAVEPQEKTDPIRAHSTECVGVAFDERTGTIVTAHEAVVVVWASATGQVVATHTLKAAGGAAARRGRRGRQRGEELIRAFTLPTMGQAYYLGTSHGRVVANKLRGGELLSDFGQLHGTEVCRLIPGVTPQGAEYVVSLAVDGSCRVSGCGATLPPSFALPHDRATAILHSSVRRMLLVGTERGFLMGVDILTVLSKGPVASDRVDPRGAAVSALCVLEALSVAVVATQSGIVSLWGLRGAPITGKELARLAVPQRGSSPCSSAKAGGAAECSSLAALDMSSSCIVVGGDYTGRVFWWCVRGGVASRSSRERRSAVARVAVVHVFEDEGVSLLEAAAMPRVFLAVSFSAHVAILDAHGHVLGLLCHGRGLPNVDWPNGGEPPYRFPDIAQALEAHQHRSAKTISLIHRFLRKLRDRVRSRKAAAARGDDGDDADEASEVTLPPPEIGLMSSSSAILAMSCTFPELRGPEMLDRPPWEAASSARGARLSSDKRSLQWSAAGAAADSTTGSGGELQDTTTRSSRTAGSEECRRSVHSVDGTPARRASAATADTTPAHASLVPPELMHAAAAANLERLSSVDRPPSYPPPAQSIPRGGVAAEVGRGERGEEEGEEEEPRGNSSDSGASLPGLAGSADQDAAGARKILRSVYSPRKVSVSLAPAPPSASAGEASGWVGRPTSNGTEGAGKDRGRCCLHPPTQLLSPSPPRIDEKTGEVKRVKGESAKVARARAGAFLAFLRANGDARNSAPGIIDTASSARSKPAAASAGISARNAPGAVHADMREAPAATAARRRAKKAMDAAAVRVMSTEEHIEAVTGQLVVLRDGPTTGATQQQRGHHRHPHGDDDSRRAAECSTREIVREMGHRFSRADAGLRRLRLLQQREPGLRYAMGRDAQAEHRRVVAELAAIEREQLAATARQQTERELRARGPPVPPAPHSRRPRKRPQTAPANSSSAST